jgi:hypothetical protein
MIETCFVVEFVATFIEEICVQTSFALFLNVFGLYIFSNVVMSRMVGGMTILIEIFSWQPSCS